MQPRRLHLDIVGESIEVGKRWIVCPLWFVVVDVVKEGCFSISNPLFHDLVYQISGRMSVDVGFESDGVAANIREVFEDCIGTGTLQHLFRCRTQKREFVKSTIEISE